MNWLDKISLGIYHAAYHRHLKRAMFAKDKSDIKLFKKYIYKAEDAWKKLIKIQNKYKVNNE
tara:strand:- start:1642 stop:1827 length:186 start_codon:yes stop_codon:yes gene_type:complete